MINNIDIESKVIERYIIKTKRDRYLALIKKDKTREKFISELYHADFFQEDLFDKLGNIKDCYVISTNPKVDRKVLDIETVLKDAISIWADEGTLIVFGDAEIIYREAEGPNKKWISKQIKSK
jgi:hypothetical protein